MYPLFEVKPFTVREAREAGTSRSRLYARDLARPFHGVRAARTPDTLLQRMLAYRTRMPPEQFFSHATSALFWAAPLPASLEQDERLHVSVVSPRFPPAGRGVVGHRLTSASVVHWRGFAIADPGTTWCHLAASLTLPDLVAVGDFFLTGHDPLHGLPPLASFDELRDAVRVHGRRRGIRTAKLALELVRQGPLSRPESLVRVAMVTAGLPEPELNPPVRMADGSTRHPDIAYSVIRFGIEYEGDGHRTDRERFRRDIERKEAFADVAWEIMRVTAQHLARPVELAARIRRRVHQRCVTLGLTLDDIESGRSQGMRGK